MLIALPVANGTFRPIQEADFWRPLALDLGFVRRFLAEDFCRSNSSRQEACIRALRSVDQKSKWAAKPSPAIDPWLIEIDRKTPDQLKSMTFAHAVNSLLRHFDAHAQLLPLEYHRTFLGEMTKSYYGVGLSTELTRAGLQIRHVFANTAASRAGLRIHDQILRIANQDVPIGPSAQRLLSLFNNPSQEPIPVELARRGRLLKVNLIPSILVSDDYTPERLTVYSRPGLVLTIRRFSHGLCEEIERFLKTEEADGHLPQWILIDLRDNPGGVRWEAQCMASLFVGADANMEREAVELKLPKEFGFNLPSAPSDQEEPPWHQKPVFPEQPIFVLTSAKSKSAAEILAAILQDRERAWIIGERTFGKGSSQMITQVAFHQQLRLSYTAWRFLRRDGSSLQINGVTPNFSQPFRKGATGPERQFFREADWEENALEPGGRVGEWHETRTEQIKRLTDCVASHNYDDKLASTLHLSDQQKVFALSLLGCSQASRNIRSAVPN